MKVRSIFEKSIAHSLGFILALLAISYLYNYHATIFYQPQSIHKWRQSDCASIALNYYQGGMRFFYPETHNLTSDGGTSGKAFTSEVPILYYGVAMLYKVFGPHDSIYRILNTLIFLLSLFYFYKLMQYLVHDLFWSVVIPLLFFTSPVLVYYGNNFLTNSTELALSIMGWYFFVRFLFEKRDRLFFIAIGLFLFAATMKITAFFSLFAIGAIGLVELFNLKQFGTNEKIFAKPMLYIAAMALAVLLVVAWVLYAHIQNTLHGCYYFSTTTFPIWDLSKEEIVKVFTQVRLNWSAQYYHLSIKLFLLGCLVYLIIKKAIVPSIIKYVLILVGIEALFFILLQYWTFADHDYYTIGLFIIPFLILVSTFYVLQKNHPSWFNSYLVKGAVLAMLIVNSWYARNETDKRYNTYINDIDDYKDVYSIQPYLRQIGIQPIDTVISIPDYCHATLYLMNQKGWTEYIDNNFNNGNRTYYNHDSSGIQKSIDNGAKYLIINGIEELYNKTYLQPFCFSIKGKYKKVLIFDLHAQDTNFTLFKKEVTYRWHCDAEQRTADGKFFYNDSVQFEYGNTQSHDFAHYGNYSIKLNQQQPYGMTVKIKDAELGESFYLSVWQYNSSGVKGDIVASVDGENITESKAVSSDSTGWEKHDATFFVSESMVGKDLVLFLYNPNEKSTYFDDFEIIRYQSVFEQKNKAMR